MTDGRRTEGYTESERDTELERESEPERDTRGAGRGTTPSGDEAAERLALVLAERGMQRMTARVLSALLFTQQPTMTMGDIAEQLQASSGAVSGALKMLTSVGLVERVPIRASRRDHYRLRDDAWATLFTSQNAALSAMLQAADAGVAAVGPASLAGRRLAQMRDFYTFMLGELPAVLDRWYQRSGSSRPFS